MSGSYREMPITWDFSVDGEGFTPYKARVDGKILRVRLNPPGPTPYTLIVDGQEVESFRDWPASWVQPNLGISQQDYGSEDSPGIEPSLLRKWSEQLCRLASDDLGDMARALGVSGSPPSLRGDSTVEPPPEGTSRMTLHKHPAGFIYAEIALSGKTLTRARLDAYFGESRDLPRIHYDSPYLISYNVEVLGAPHKCAVFARFRQDPANPTAAAFEITLRRD
jgi:hypothetical protein